MKLFYTILFLFDIAPVYSQKKKVQGNIIQKILEAGFKISGMKMIKLSDSTAEKFYEVHQSIQGRAGRDHA